MNTIVTHRSPDLDAIASIWLIKKYLPGWTDPRYEFVDAGDTFENSPVDSNESIIHVDTGFGMFDHHHVEEKTCAAQLVLRYLIKQGVIREKYLESVHRFVNLVCRHDNFDDADNPDDIFSFAAGDIIFGYHSISHSDKETIAFGLDILESSYRVLNQKILAEHELPEGFVFQSPWGKSLAIQTKNSNIAHVAINQGFKLVIWQQPEKRYLRIKKNPRALPSLEKLYEQLMEKDPKATWYYQPAGSMIINGSAYNPNVVKTKLSLKQVVELVKGI